MFSIFPVLFSSKTWELYHVLGPALDSQGSGTIIRNDSLVFRIPAVMHNSLSISRYEPLQGRGRKCISDFSEILGDGPAREVNSN